MRTLQRVKTIVILFILLLLVSPVALARDYIEVWPEGWSDISTFFRTSIFADRFFVVNDQAGTGILSVDGLYFKELDLSYRFVQGDTVVEHIVLKPKAEIESAFMSVDQANGRHILWLERSPEGNSINYTKVTVPYLGHEIWPIVETHHTIQDLAAFQEGETTHLVWSERDGYFQIKYAQVKQGELLVLETVTDTEDLSVRPSITVDAAGTPHITWLEATMIGFDLRYSKRLEGGWTPYRKVGEGSVQDLQQGGGIAMASFNREVYILWSTMPHNSSSLFVHLAIVDQNGNISTPERLTLGTKAQFVTSALEPEIVWQGVGPFGAQVNHAYLKDGRLHEITNLTVGRKGAFRPEAFAKGEFRYVYWLQAQAEPGFTVSGINNEFAKAISIWRKVGLDEEAPMIHLLFLFMSTLMLAGVYTVTNGGVLIIAGVIYSVLQRFGAYSKQPLFYQVALLATILIVLRRLPIPAGNPEFFGLVHYGLSYALATVGTFLILRKVKQRGFFLTLSVLLVWMLLFQFFALVPQSILT